MEVFATPQRSAQRRRSSTPPSCAASIGKPTRRGGRSPSIASVRRSDAAPRAPLPAATRPPARSSAMSKHCISPTSHWPALARTDTTRRGSTSCAKCGPPSIAPPTRSTRAAAPAIWPTPSTLTSSASRPSAPSALRCFATFTAGAPWSRGCAQCWRSATSIASAPAPDTLLSRTTTRRRQSPRRRRGSILIGRDCLQRCGAASPPPSMK